jgi:hypothetical protein
MNLLLNLPGVILAPSQTAGKSRAGGQEVRSGLQKKGKWAANLQLHFF